MWGHTYDWATAEVDWSSGWGGADNEWYAAILPRIHHLLPARSVVEIGCGHGRWTAFLRDHAGEIRAVDVAEPCVAATRARFGDDDRVNVTATDGHSVGPVPDRTVDLVFSFDSLVHADPETMDAYLGEMARVLTDDGTGFVHHSNLADCRTSRTHRMLRRVPLRVPLLSVAFVRMGVPDAHLHWRDPSVGAASVSAAAERHGLRCLTQELVPWGTGRTLIDCISTIVRIGSTRDRGRHVIENRAFAAEAPALAALARANLPPAPVAP